MNAGDRLDQLAYKYYGQPLQWWHICDANPDFLSPLAPLGRGAGRHDPLPGDRIRYAALGRAVACGAGDAGRRGSGSSEDIQLVPQQSTVGGQTITAFSGAASPAPCSSPTTG